MTISKGLLIEFRLSHHIADGTRARLDFDFACQRGHSFGEYHVHGVVNEILCSNLDPTHHRVHAGFAHPDLQTPGSNGRRREVDFAVEFLGSGVLALCAEVKWAGSSHCTEENVLRDLCRLQLIKNTNPKTDCVFVLAGRTDEIDKLFSSGILKQGTNCLLHRSRTGVGIRQRGAKRRTKSFRLEGNRDHAESLLAMLPSVHTKMPKLPASVFSHLVYSARTTQGHARFQSLVWAIEADDAVEPSSGTPTPEK